MNLQEIFDRVANHLLTQSQKAEDSSGSCAYRGSGGTSCAVGCLITDEVYNQFAGYGRNRLEGVRVHNGEVIRALEMSGISLSTGVPLTLLRDLQNMHDTEAPEKWANSLRVIAQRFNLTTKFVSALNP